MTIESGYPEEALLLSTHQTLEQTGSTALWDNEPVLQSSLQEKILSNIVDFPNYSYTVGIAGETGSNKGSKFAHGVLSITQNESFQGQLEAINKSLAQHAVTTSHMVKESLRRFDMSFPWGSPSPEQFDQMTKMADYGIHQAEYDLPRTDPESVHLFWLEFAGVVLPWNVGAEIFAREGRSVNTIIYFNTTTPSIHERGYHERKTLENLAESEEEEQQKKVFKKAQKELRIRYDMDLPSVMRSRGSSKTIVDSARLINDAMRVLYTKGEIRHLPSDTPSEVLGENDPSNFVGESLDTYFENLTVFREDGAMETNPIRPWLQGAYYEYIAKEKWGVVNYEVLYPSDVGSETVIDYNPNITEEIALPLGSFVDDRYPLLPRTDEVFREKKKPQKRS